MVYRYSWIAGIAGMALALVRLQGLVQASSTGAPWPLVVIAGAALGAIITWTAFAYRVHSALVVVINLVALAFTAVRIAVPDTTSFLLPTSESLSAIRTELAYAFDVIRSGVAPVIPASGLVVVITAVFWGLGALLVWGLRRGRPFLALTPPALLYLQLATADRGAFAGPQWALALLAIVAAGLAAVTFDERATTGRLARVRARVAGGVVSGKSLVTLVVAATLALGTSAAFAGTVPATGVLDWRQSTGLTGSYFGSVSYNPFVSIQKSLVSQRDIPVFAARISGDVRAADVYWRLLSLDTFNGTWWYARNPEVERLEDASWEDDAAAFEGPREQVVQDITILQLRNDWLPSAYSVESVEAPDEEIERGMRVAPDGSIRFGSGSFRGMSYRVRSAVPQPDIDVLATNEDGTPTRVFAEAAVRGAVRVPTDRPEPRPAPPDPDRFLDLPEELEPAITELAEGVTFGLTSNYERGLALEAFLRNPANGFVYSTEVTPGANPNDLATWLTDPTSEQFRLGYCEQFATAMGVMARAVGIPSRVVLGFTPGRAQADGTIIVLDTNAHAWVELWLPSQGWVRFDPTPRGDGVNPSTVDAVAARLGTDLRPLLEVQRPDTPDLDTSALPPALLAEELPQRVLGPGGGVDEEGAGGGLPGWLPALLAVLGVLAALFGVVPAIKAWRRRRRLRRLRSGDISAAWAEITDRLGDLGEPPRPSQTPLEYAAGTDEALQPLAGAYSQSIYGAAGVTDAMVDVAERSLITAENNVGLRYSPTQRFLARYRIKSLLPASIRRLTGKRRPGPPSRP